MAETVIKRLAGTGEVGYNDGEPGSVQFNKPRSFAVDSKGNVYVADRNNFVIRKINTLGFSIYIFFSFFFLQIMTRSQEKKGFRLW